MLNEFDMLHKIIDCKSYERVFDIYEKEFELYKSDYNKYTSINKIGKEHFKQKIVYVKRNKENINIFFENDNKSILIEFKDIELNEDINKVEKETLKSIIIQNHKNNDTKLYDFKKITIRKSFDSSNLSLILYENESNLNIGKLTIISEELNLKENIVYSYLSMTHGEYKKTIHKIDKNTDYNKFKYLVKKFLIDRNIDDIINFEPKLRENKNNSKINILNELEEKELLKNLIIKIEKSLIADYIKKVFNSQIVENIFIFENYKLYGNRLINIKNPNIYFQSGLASTLKEKHSYLHIEEDFKIYSINETKINIYNKAIKFYSYKEIDFSEISIQKNNLYYKIQDSIGQKFSLTNSYSIFDYETGNSRQNYERVINKLIFELNITPKRLKEVAFPVGDMLEKIEIIQLEKDINDTLYLKKPFEKIKDLILLKEEKEYKNNKIKKSFS